MVEKIQYRWDFIGLSTDTKPTPETNDRVANGSTFYCSDTSKLYVWYKDQWYEKTVSGGGGGTSNFNQLSNRPKYNGVAMTGDTDIPEVETYSDFTGTDGQTAGTSGLVPAPATTDAGKFLKADGTWDTAGGGGGGGIKFLSASDFNYDDGETGSFNSIALWLLDDGFYFMPSNYTDVPVKGCLDGTNSDRFNNDVQHGYFFCFIKAGNNFWMFVNLSNQDNIIYANRSIYLCTINRTNGWFGYDGSRQLATRNELPS